MPTPPVRRSRILERGMYARTTGNFLLNDPNGFPSDYPPALWWYGYDSGAGTYPIGPNGPWTTMGPAIPTVTRATQLITGPLTVAPFRVFDGAPAGQPLGTPRWLLDPTLTRPTWAPEGWAPRAVGQRARSLFWAEWLRSAIWWGLGGFLWLPDQGGGPMAGTMAVINPGLLHTTRDDGGALVWQVDTADGPITFDRAGEWADAGATWRITVLRNPLSPVDAEGMSQGVFAMSPSVFSLSGTLETYQAGQFRAGVPNGYLKTSVPGMNQTDADKLKGKWLEAHGGSRRSIAILNSTTEFVPINLSPVDAALDQVKRLNVADVAFAFGLDPMTLGAGLNNSATYSNLRDAWENHRDFGLGPWIAAVQDTLSALLPGTQNVTVNLDGFANPTASERYAGYAAAIAAGILTVDEVRALEGLPPPAAAPAAPPPAPPAPASPVGEIP